MAINNSYPSGCGSCLAVFHIIMGLGSCGCGAAAIYYKMYLYKISLGIWAGIGFYVITGILGLAASSRKNGVVGVYYAWSLLSVFVSMAQMGLFAWVFINEIINCTLAWPTYNTGFNFSSCYNSTDMIIAAVAGSLGFLEWIFAMVSCCVSCSCCCNTEAAPPTQTVIIQAPGGMPVQTGYVSQPGYVLQQQPAFVVQQQPYVEQQKPYVRQQVNRQPLIQSRPPGYNSAPRAGRNYPGSPDHIYDNPACDEPGQEMMFQPSKI